jgi:hypothetical protein
MYREQAGSFGESRHGTGRFALVWYELAQSITLSEMHHRLPRAAALFLLSLPAAAVADQLSDVVAMEAQCEHEREVRIKPLRDMEIAKCKADSHNDAAYCDRYWKDYGNRVRTPNGTMTPRMFDDLPICLAAFEARKALINRNGF